MDQWTVYASSGEYQIEGESAGHAFLNFVATHPDDYVSAIVNRDMQPALVLQEMDDPKGLVVNHDDTTMIPFSGEDRRGD